MSTPKKTSLLIVALVFLVISLNGIMPRTKKGPRVNKLEDLRTGQDSAEQLEESALPKLTATQRNPEKTQSYFFKKLFTLKRYPFGKSVTEKQILYVRGKEANLEDKIREGKRVLRKPNGQFRAEEALNRNLTVKGYRKQGEQVPNQGNDGHYRRREKRSSNTKTSKSKLKCKRSFSCKNRCYDEKKFTREAELTCYCDEECLYFKDCCADFETFCKINNIKNATSGLHRETVNIEEWKCFPWWNGRTLMNGALGIWMVGSCPLSWRNRETALRCNNLADPDFPLTSDNFIDSLPVFTPNGTVYRNRFCAECNGAPLSNLTRYAITLACESFPSSQLNEKQQIDFLLKYCRSSVSWNIESSNPRRYCLDLHSTCNAQGTRYRREKCINGSVGVVYSSIQGNTNYKNIHCFLCNGYDTQEAECGPKISKLVTGPGPVKPFSVIFNFGNKKQSPGKSSSIYCPEKKVYDPYLETCRVASYVGQVSQQPSSSHFNEYQILLWLSKTNDSEKSRHLSAETFKAALSDAFLINSSAISILASPSSAEELDKPFKLLFNIKMNVDSTRKIDKRAVDTHINFDRVLEFESPFNFTVNGTVFTVFKATKRILSCANLKQYRKYEYALLPDQMSAVYLNETGLIIKAKDYYFNSTSVNNSVIFVCQGSQGRRTPGNVANCSGTFVAMKESEYTMLPNGTIRINVSGEIYNSSKYFIKNSTLWVCRNFSRFYKKETLVLPKENKLLAIVTTVCMALSVVGLAFFIFTYSIFSELRTPPGINLMNLSSSILAAQLLWLLGSGKTNKPILCAIVAAMLHYFYLVSFMWTSLIAYDTWAAFSSNTNLTVPSRRKKITRSLQYMAVGWLPLMVCIVGCGILDRLSIIHIGYGSDTACWMSNRMAILYAFALPVGISIIFNLIFYILTVRTIKRTTDQARMAAQNSQTRQHFGIYVRIGVLMGFTWMFGFGAAFVPSLWYPFVILNCLQGVYIAVAFALSDRARKLYKGMFTMKMLARQKSLSRMASASSQSTITRSDRLEQENRLSTTKL